MNLKNDDGFALALSFIIILVLVILVSAISSVVINEVNSSKKYYREKQAYYLARAGAEYAIANPEIFKNLSKNESYVYKLNNLKDQNFEDVELNGINNYNNLPKNNSIEVFVKNLGNNFFVYSLGIYEETYSHLSVTLNLETGSIPPLDYALFASGTGENVISLNGSSYITGDVGTNADSFSAIDLTGGSGIDGDFWINTVNPNPPGEHDEEPRFPSWSSENTPYNANEKVYFNGLHYKAKWRTTDPPGSSNAWNLIIPEDEIWKYFASHTYQSGEQVWHDGQIYTAQWNGINNPPPGNGWEKQVPNITGDIDYLNQEIDYPSPEIPDFPSPPNRDDVSIKGNSSGEINQDGNFDTISIKGDNKLIVNRNGGDRIIRVKNLDIKQGHIEFENPSDDGILKIYIEDKLTLGGDSSINKPSSNQNAIPENVEIYYKGTEKPNLGGNIVINGSLFIENADFDIGGSNSNYGYIFSNGENITVRGAANVSTIYAPNTHIDMRGLGNSESILEGVVIAKSFDARGAAEIQFVKPDLSKMPKDFLTALKESQDGVTSKVKTIKWSRN